MLLTALVSPEQDRRVAARAHRLAGIAGMYGHPLITEAALALEAAAELGEPMEEPGQRLIALLAALESS